MRIVWILYHVHEFQNDLEDEVKIVGLYESSVAAAHALTRAQTWRGFAETKEDFQIHAYNLDEDHWASGFVTVICRE